MDPSAVIARFAREQHGFVKHRQLLDAGLSADVIRTRRERGELTEHFRGVYRAGPMPPTRRGLCKAATLALDGAAVGHDHGCELHGLVRRTSGPIHLTRVKGAGWTSQPGLVVHRIRSLPDGWRTEVEGIAVVAPMLAVIEAGGRRGPVGVRSLLDQAETKEVLDVAAFDRFIEALPKARNRAALRAAIDPFRKQLHKADHGLGTRFLRWCHERRLPLPGTNVPIGSYEVDFHWAGTPLIVETDGFEAHRDRSAFDRDRERWSALAALGYTVIVVTHTRLGGDSGGLFREIVAVLARAGAIPGRSNPT